MALHFFKGLQLKHHLSTFETVYLINGSSVKPYVIKSGLPLYVIGTVTFDSDSLKNRLDNGHDAWRWEVYKTQTSFTVDISKEGSYNIQFVRDSRNLETSNVTTSVLTITSFRGKY